MIKKLKQLFTEHPDSVDESYIEHTGVALYFGFSMFFTSLALFVHAFLPFLFVKTGGQTVTHLYDRMITSRNKNAKNSVDKQVNDDGQIVEYFI